MKPLKKRISSKNLDQNTGFRPAQARFASAISAFLARNGDAPLLLEGSAGLGKTRAYLTVMTNTDKPIAVVVPTRALAAQLVESADMACVRGSRTVEIYTPRRHFEELAEYEGNRAKIDAAYLAHKDACLAADILICTHQALFIDVWAEGGLLNLKDRYAIAVDEADQLPEAAALRLDCRISVEDLHALKVATAFGKRQSFATMAQSVLAAVARDNTKVNDPVAVKAAAKAILAAVTGEPAWYKSVSFCEYTGLQLKHKLPARTLKALYTHPRLMFFSATLTTAGEFKHFKNALGLPSESSLSKIIEPEHHGHLDFVIEKNWNKDDLAHWQRCADHIKQLGGNTLVITTSHKASSELASLLPNAIARNRDETTAAASKRMEDEKKSILIAAGAWAGLDTPVRWAHVVMPVAPYAPPLAGEKDQPDLVDTDEPPPAKDSTSERDKKYSYLASKGTGLRRFRQGLARGLRTPDAQCTIHLLDSRFLSDNFLASVPQRFKPDVNKAVTPEAYQQLIRESSTLVADPGTKPIAAKIEVADTKPTDCENMAPLKAAPANTSVVLPPSSQGFYVPENIQQLTRQDLKPSLTLRESRPVQAEFRKALIEFYHGTCAITGCTDLTVLEAAHLGAPGEWRTNNLKGILLRSDLHKLLDSTNPHSKLEIVDNIVHITSPCPGYQQYNGVEVTIFDLTTAQAKKKLVYYEEELKLS